MIAACTLEPGVYFAVNSPAGVVGATPEAAVATISGVGLPRDASSRCNGWRQQVGEQSLFFRTGGAPSLALGMAHIFSSAGGGGVAGLLVPLRDHVRGAVHPDDHRCRHARRAVSCCRTCWGTSTRRSGGRAGCPASSARARRSCWRGATFLIQGVRDPLGGINSLWPLFGIANQLLAAIALCGGHDDPAQDARPALHLDHAASAGVARHRDLRRRLAEDPFSIAARRVSRAGESARGGDRRRARSRRAGSPTCRR